MKVMDFSPANCKNCYKCLRSCSVKAIRIVNDQARIDEDLCIGCGDCFVVCPQNARSVLSDLHKVKEQLMEGERIVVSLAPSYKGIFKEDDQLVEQLYRKGFYRVEETAIGAKAVTEVYQAILAGSEGSWITSCCPVVNQYIQKYFPNLTHLLLPVQSPMMVHGKSIKERYKEGVKVVFVGPCIAKKKEVLDESQHMVSVDSVITFEELEQWLEQEENIGNGNEKVLGYDNRVIEDRSIQEGHHFGQAYPMDGGIIGNLVDSKRELLAISGLKGLREVLIAFEKGELLPCVIEANACEGGCINGPAIPINKRNRAVATMRLRKKVTTSNFIIEASQTEMTHRYLSNPILTKQPIEEKIQEILMKMGKRKKIDELNCGACGYDSCRENAIAVYNQMSHVEMCIPNMRTRAERMINSLFKHTPNVVIILDEKLRIVEFNPMAERLFSSTSEQMAMCSIDKLLDTKDFFSVKESGESLLGKKISLDDYGLSVSLNIIYLENQNLYLTIMHNLTEEEKKHKELTALKESTLDTAQKIINKQMRVAQEIASLLGETTAETKVTLMKLQKLVRNEEVG